MKLLSLATNSSASAGYVSILTLPVVAALLLLLLGSATQQHRLQRQWHLQSAADAMALSAATIRSEEHTSELQSRPHLVCRLLLEKKNRITSRCSECGRSSDRCSTVTTQLLGSMAKSSSATASGSAPSARIRRFSAAWCSWIRIHIASSA